MPSNPKAKPAFEGAKFDRNGACLKHSSVQMADNVIQDGKIMWKEMKANCPKCATDHHRSRRVTSLNATKVKRIRTVHGMNNPLKDHSKGKHMDRAYDTPFNEQGQCHHHSQIQLATKNFRGGWKVLMKGCPKCIEANYEEGADDRSVCSRKSTSSRNSRASNASKKSTASKKSKKGAPKRIVTTRNTAVTRDGKFDKNGCCVRHAHVQVAKKKLLGGWKLARDCPKCADPTFDDMGDMASVTSRSSRKSARSAKSGRSVRSGGGRGGGNNRYGALPFDQEGYCHEHPSVKLAKKKTLGGWKVIHDICPDCARDAGSDAGSRASKKSGTGRVFDDTGSDCSSSVHSGASKKKKKIRARDLKFRDEEGREGRYTGDVNEDHKPHGQGKMKYRDGTSFSGVWSEGSQVHGKTSRKSSSTSRKSSSSDWARRDGGGAGGNTKAKTVRKMKWMDYYGDPGEYTGEVDNSNMPNGKGGMRYDHGLVQEGLWNKGQFVEGSDVDGGGGGDAGKGESQRSGQRSAQKTPPRRRSNSRPREDAPKVMRGTSQRGTSQRGVDP